MPRLSSARYLFLLIYFSSYLFLPLVAAEQHHNAASIARRDNILSNLLTSTTTNTATATSTSSTADTSTSDTATAASTTDNTSTSATATSTNSPTNTQTDTSATKATNTATSNGETSATSTQSQGGNTNTATNTNTQGDTTQGGATPPPSPTTTITSTSLSTNAQGETETVVVTITPSASASATSSSSSVSTTANSDASSSSSSLSTGGIVGLSVAGGVVLLSVIAFAIFKASRKRYLDEYDDAEGIKWPELNHGGDSPHALPTHRTGGAGFETSSEVNLTRPDSRAGSIAPSAAASTTELFPSHDPYAVPPLPHLNPNVGGTTQPYHDDPAAGYYDPYSGPVPRTLEGENIPMTQIGGPARSRSPMPGGPATSLAPPMAGMRSPSPGPGAYAASIAARAASPGPGAYASQMGAMRTASPAPAYTPSMSGVARAASPGPNMAYGGANNFPAS